MTDHFNIDVPFCDLYPMETNDIYELNDRYYDAFRNNISNNVLVQDYRNGWNPSSYTDINGRRYDVHGNRM